MSPAEIADHIRHLVADTREKINSEDELDEGYVLEDLLHRLLVTATATDGHKCAGPAGMDYQRHTIAYELEPRETFGELRGEEWPALAGCPFTFSHTRHWCGYSTCRES